MGMVILCPSPLQKKDIYIYIYIERERERERERNRQRKTSSITSKTSYRGERLEAGQNSRHGYGPTILLLTVIS